MKCCVLFGLCCCRDELVAGVGIPPDCEQVVDMQAAERVELERIDADISKYGHIDEIRKNLPARITTRTDQETRDKSDLVKRRDLVQHKLKQMEEFMTHLSNFTQGCQSVDRKFRPLFMSMGRLSQWVYRGLVDSPEREIHRWPSTARGYLVSFEQGATDLYREHFDVPRDKPFARAMAALAGHL